MSNDFERVKSSVDLKAFIMSETGLAMKGKHLLECPFCGGHECFSIPEDKGFFKCHQCDTGGDVFTFIEKKNDVDSKDALKYVAERLGITLDAPSTPKAKQEELSPKDRIFLAAAEYYHGHMLENGGREYLIAGRGHTEDVLKKMRVGWSDGNLIGHLRAKGYTDADIIASGLVTQKEDKPPRDFFGDKLVIFPHYDNGRVLHFTMKDPAKKLTYQLKSVHRDKGWAFYNQDAFTQDEVILVEGENDLLSVMRAGFKNVIAMIGQLSEAQIDVLKSRMRHKTLYLWVDKDEAGTKYVEKVSKALTKDHHTVKIIIHPGETKDPDEYLKTFQGDLKAEVHRLIASAQSYVGWKIEELAAISDPVARLDAFREHDIFRTIGLMQLADRDAYVERLVGLGLSREAVEKEMEHAGELKAEISAYFENIQGGAKNADPIRIANIMFSHFDRHGRFFRDPMHNVHLFYDGHVHTVSNNRPFNALVMKTTGLLATKEPGRSVWEALSNHGYNKGLQITLASWLSTDLGKDEIFIHMNMSDNCILKVTPKSIEEVQNGLNPDNVLLKSSGKIAPVKFDPNASIKAGFQALKRTIFDNLTCEAEQKYFILSWAISAFLLDFAPYIALLKFSGATASGKTTAARLVNILLHGDRATLGQLTGAAAYASASQNPLVILDNLESDDVNKGILNFLLLGATRGGKEKRSAASDHDTIVETPKCLICVTAIEPFPKAELINRTFDIGFERALRNDGFIEVDVIRDLLHNRDLILSAILKFIQKFILPNLAKRRDYIQILKRQYKGHSKDRTDEYTALLILVFDQMYPLLAADSEFPVAQEKSDITDKWISYQNAKARDTETGSNTILTLLEGIMAKCMYIFNKGVDPSTSRPVPTEKAFDPKRYGDQECRTFTHPTYMIDPVLTEAKKIMEGDEELIEARFCLEVTTQQLNEALGAYAKETGKINPFHTTAHLGSRLSNDKALLEKAGWKFITNEKGPYYRIQRGERYLRMERRVVK